MKRGITPKAQVQKTTLRACKGRAAHGCRKSSKPKKVTKKEAQARIFETEVSVFKKLCKAVNTPFSNEALKMVEDRNWLGIAKAPFPDPDSPTFADDYLIQQVMRKNPRLPIKVDREAKAKEKWFEVEDWCRQTNDLIRSSTRDSVAPSITGPKVSLAIKPSVLKSIRSTISSVLGPVTKGVLEDLQARARFGPGASFHCSSKNLTTAKKLEAAIGLTPSLKCFLGSLEPPGWLATTSGYRITAGNKARFVPKDALVDRFIAIEPSLNMWWQLGIGSLIKTRLKRVGLNLSKQADLNRLRVRFAQITGLATIDLESASDSIARLVVKLLFPKDWEHLLSLFRSEETLLDGVWHRLEKFSSMGNGFTFELETLLFYAVCKAFDEDPFVFGDDMIVRQDIATPVIRTLNILGFRVNEKKTFLAGNFFESCGSDYWHGRNVRPFYFNKDKHHDYTSAVIRMANAVRRYANRRNLNLGCDSRFLPAWLYLCSRSDTARRTGIPEGYGDVGIVREFDDAAPKKLRNGHCGYIARTYTSLPETVDVTNRLSGVMSSLMQSGSNFKFQIGKHPVYGSPQAPQYGQPTPRMTILESDGQREWYTQGEKASVTVQAVRDRVGAARLRGMPVQHWHGLGPWL